MARDPGVDSDLRRWAASRAPSLLARAEAEALEVLRDALVDAAVHTADEPADRRNETRRARERELPNAPPSSDAPTSSDAPMSSTSESGSLRCELLWTYCVIRASDAFPAEMPGVDPEGILRPVRSGDLVALVSSVPRSEFGSEPLRRNLNDVEWLERVARSHEGVLDATLQMSTLVPLRMCTLYESDEGVRGMLERERDAFASALERLENRWEWAVKVLVDEDRLLSAAQLSSDPTQVTEDEPEGQGTGGAYLRRRRLERDVRDAASTLATDIAQQVHARLQDWALDAVTHPAQNRELSGHQGEMLLNAAYLVERERTQELGELVAELEARHAELGARIELTGPWPPYNFVSAGGPSPIT